MSELPHAAPRLEQSSRGEVPTIRHGSALAKEPLDRWVKARNRTASGAIAMRLRKAILSGRRSWLLAGIALAAVAGSAALAAEWRKRSHPCRRPSPTSMADSSRRALRRPAAERLRPRATGRLPDPVPNPEPGEIRGVRRGPLGADARVDQPGFRHDRRPLRRRLLGKKSGSTTRATGSTSPSPASTT